jgi:hypothetical protein
VDGNNEENSGPQEERRQRVDLRGIFDDVLARVSPFYKDKGDSLENWASHAVREAYPDLDEQGLLIVVRAALRVCRERASSGQQ